MHNKSEFDYIIVGQGIAGSVLSYHLIERGKRVLVIDEGSPLTSSKVAAGLYNPVTGRKMVKTWKADELFPYLESFYGNLERILEGDFLHKKLIYRPFISIEEQNEWMGKSASADYDRFISKVFTQSKYDFVNDPYGGIELKYSGYVDLPVFLNLYRNYLRQNNSLQETLFDVDDLRIERDHISYGEARANRLIFCDGLKASKNRYFDWLPFKPVKGEILRMTIDIETSNIINRGVFVVPVADNECRVGSNYNNHDLSLTPTDEARNEIESKFNDLLNCEYSICDHVAGIRPATRDRRPLIGMHPEYETIGIFNGLGTKGVSLAPYFAGSFIDYLEDGGQLIPEVSISRYFSLYYDSLNN